MNSAIVKNDKTGNVVTLPARYYHDAEIYEQERESIFKNQWLFFGHESLMAGQGDYLAQTIAGWPLLVIRDKEGYLKGFHNVCRHRASQVLREGHGKTPALRCMYHGWVYDTDGQLKKTPGYGGDEKATCENHSLFPVHVQSWKGLVFVCLSDNTPPAFEEALGDLPEALKDVDLTEYHFQSMDTHKLDCNWKTYVENYMEGYHIPAVHPELNKEIDMDTYRVVPGDKIATHVVDTSKEDAISGGLWVWLWPYTAINLYKNGMNLEMMIPTGPETCELKYCYLFKDVSPEMREENQKTIDLSFSVTQEDIEIVEIVQRNLKAGIYDTGELSPEHENGVAYFQKLVRESLAT